MSHVLESDAAIDKDLLSFVLVAHANYVILQPDKKNLKIDQVLTAKLKKGSQNSPDNDASVYLWHDRKSNFLCACYPSPLNTAELTLPLCTASYTLTCTYSMTDAPHHDPKSLLVLSWLQESVLFLFWRDCEQLQLPRG